MNIKHTKNFQSHLTISNQQKYIKIYKLMAILLISDYGNDKQFRVDELMEHVRAC